MSGVEEDFSICFDPFHLSLLKNILNFLVFLFFGTFPYYTFNRKDRNQEISVHTKHPIWPICIMLVGWTCHVMQRRNLFQGYFMNKIISIFYLTYWLRKSTLKEHTLDGEEMHFIEKKKAGHIELATAWSVAERNCQSSPLPCRDVIMSVVLLLCLLCEGQLSEPLFRPMLSTFPSPVFCFWVYNSRW